MYKCKATINDKEYSADGKAINMEDAYREFELYVWKCHGVELVMATSLTIDEVEDD